MLLTLARHGETIENTRRIVQGQIPGKLTRRGHMQAKALADRLKLRQFDAIYSSDLARCLDTARYVRRYHSSAPFYMDSDLREISFGEFEGKLESEVDWHKPMSDFWSYSRGGGETNQQLKTRVIAAVNKMYDKYPDGKVLVVTHGWPFKVVQSVVTGQDLAELYAEWLDNCATLDLAIDQTLECRFGSPVEAPLGVMMQQA